jgi:hypothetical protein
MDGFKIAAHHRRKKKCATLKAKQHARRRGGGQNEPKVAISGDLGAKPVRRVSCLALRATLVEFFPAISGLRCG